MRKFKVFLWIFIIFLLQTTVFSRIHIFLGLPSVIPAYVISVALLDDDFDAVAVITIVCAFLSGALCGREFTVMTLYIVFTSFFIFSFKHKPRYMGMFPKALFYVFILSGVFEIMYFFMRNMTVTVQMLLWGALPTAIVNTLLCVILFPILKRTMYRAEEKKLVLGEFV